MLSSPETDPAVDHFSHPRRLALLLGAILLSSLLSSTSLATQEPADTNYDENQVPAYALPDPFKSVSGEAITTTDAWLQTRRPEILKVFAEEVYGVTPQFHLNLQCDTIQVVSDALAGKATRKLIRIWPLGRAQRLTIDLLLYLPNQARGPVPVFLGLNYGNQGIDPDPSIPPSRNSAAAPGEHAHRWPIEMLLTRGYGVASFHGGDLELDRHGSGCVAPAEAQRPLLEDLDPSLHDPRPGTHWGSIAKWAWGLSRALDALELDPAIDPRRVIVQGHSRTGKTALWAAANDPRFAMVISNNSGQGGAALGRRRFGETIAASYSLSGSWYCPNFEQYGGQEDRLPVDAHLLLSCIAPRCVYVASAATDGWADPRGEFLAAQHASPVWELFQTTGLAADQQPEIGISIGHRVGYHVRAGDHEITPYDWQRFIDFADRHLRPRRVLYNFDGDSCLSTKANSKGPVPVSIDDVRTLLQEVAYEESRVDTVLVCINAQVMYYPTRIGTLRGTLSTNEERAAWPASETQRFANLQAFFDAGVDPYAVMLEEARRRGCEALLTFRMNDNHGNDFLRTQFQVDHPEFRLGDQSYQGLGALDFAQAQVREHVIELIEEAVQRYDCDGIELDFNRFPRFFRADVPEAVRVEMLDDLVRQVRGKLDLIGRERDRRLILSVRVPSNFGSSPPTPASARAIGCDIAHWARQGWIDFVAVSEFLFERGDLPIQAWRNVLPHTPLYAGIECTRGSGQRNLSAEDYQAAAKHLMIQPCDGIYLFNFFTSREEGPQAYEPPFQVLKDLGRSADSPGTLPP